MTHNKTLYEELISLDFSTLPDDRAIQCLGTLIDISDINQKREGLDYALELSNKLFQRDLDEKNTAILHYFIANLWSSKRRLSYNGNNEIWKWQQQEFEEEIRHLRFALLHFSQPKNFHDDISKTRSCQIYTNLGNLFDTVGRFVESLEYYNKALELNPQFSMAMGNKGITLFHYGNCLHNCNEKILFLKKSSEYLQKAIAIEADIIVKKEFQYYYQNCESWLKQANYKNNPKKVSGNPLGNLEEERKYRSWCLKHQLFLNPLNDITAIPDAANDNLLLSPLTLQIDNPPVYFEYFNHLKQEYVSARFVFYQSIISKKPHFSDRCVPLVDTLNYSIFSTNIEGLKTSFRVFYSIFDKIGFFMNKYLDLKIPENRVYFHTLWYEKGRTKDRILRQEFICKKNWPFRGLFWLSKDLLFGEDNDIEPIEPEAKDLKNLRNHLEHKFCIIHENFSSITNSSNDYYSLSNDELERKTLKIMKTARAAIIYLAVGIHQEELRTKNENSNITVPMFLPTKEEK